MTPSCARPLAQAVAGRAFGSRCEAICDQSSASCPLVSWLGVSGDSMCCASDSEAPVDSSEWM